MQSILMTTGIACIITAIIGGGFRAYGLEFPVLRSVRRQWMIGLLGVMLVMSAAILGKGEKTPEGAPTGNSDQPMSGNTDGAGMLK